MGSVALVWPSRPPEKETVCILFCWCNYLNSSRLEKHVSWLFVGLSFLTIYYLTASCQHVHCCRGQCGKYMLRLLCSCLQPFCAFSFFRKIVYVTDFHKKNVFPKIKPRVKLSEHTNLNLIIKSNIICLNFAMNV